VRAEALEIDARASVLMKQGMRLLDDDRHDTLAEAVTLFDRARDLRCRLPIDDVPVFRYGLAACWLNRADALMRMRDQAQLPAAICACDEGIALLKGLPLGDDARFPRRLAMAHQNRGLALQAQAQRATPQAIAAFREALAVLDQDHAVPIPDRRYLQAAVWTNLASAYAREEGDESWTFAKHAALRAVSFVTETEDHDAAAAEVGLKARHVMCVAMAGRLHETIAIGGAMADDVHSATDVADEGLSLARRWEQKGVTRFRDLAVDLFRFGAHVYARYQPQFLGEFVADNMNPAHSSQEYVESAEMRAAAHEALKLQDPDRG
jgi:hypothetical protein